MRPDLHGITLEGGLIPRITAFATAHRECSLLTGRRFGVGFVRIRLVRLVMADRAAGRCAQLAIARHAACAPPTMAPLMQPLACAPGRGGERNRGTQAAAIIHFMVRPPIVGRSWRSTRSRPTSIPAPAARRPHALAQRPVVAISCGGYRSPSTVIAAAALLI
jgi:hypothetical protein